jgi:hypothetical protein
MFGLLDMAIAGVPVVLFCIWQLVSVNREIAKDKRSPKGPRHPVREHRLDDR